MDACESKEFFLSKCCIANYKAVLTDKGEWILLCTKCGKICAVLEEYTIDPTLYKF